MNDKRGINFSLISIFVFALVGVILMGFLGFIFNSINSGLDVDVMAGQVNLSNATAQTFGVFTTAYNNNMDLFGMFLIFGMIFGFLIASFLMRGKWDKILIIVDIIILVVVYITAVMLSNYYETLLIASSNVITQFEGNMPKSSNFLLHLPRYVVIIGVTAMVLFYAGIPRRENEKELNYQEGGF